MAMSNTTEGTDAQNFFSQWLSESGMMLTGFMAFVEAIDEDGQECHLLLCAEGQTLRTSLGQVEYANLMIRSDVKAHVETDNFDGE